MDIQARIEQAIRWHSEGELDRAAAEYEALLAISEHPEVHRLRGVIGLQTGDLEAAGRHLGRAQALSPGSLEVRTNLASLHQARGDLDRAVSLLHQVCEEAPERPELQMNLANALLEQGAHAEAEAAYQRSLDARPGHLESRLGLAAAARARGDQGRAEPLVQAVLAEAPGHPEAVQLLASLAADRGDTDAAEAGLRQVMISRPNPTAATALAQLLEEDGRWDAALELCLEVLDAAPEPGVLSQALHLSRRLCRWDISEPLTQRFSAWVDQGRSGCSPFVALGVGLSPEQQLTAARAWSADIQRRVEAASPPPWRPAGPNTPLRVGFMSNGFGAHPTGALSVELFEQLAASALEIHGYSLGSRDGSAVQQRLDAAFDPLIDLSGHHWSEVLERIRADQLDVLVDMRGHGGGAMTEVFAAGAARQQIAWLAYPGTMGASFMDGVIADPEVLPGSLEGAFDEPVFRLPCYQPVDTRRLPSAAPSRIDCGLPETGPVLACFNNGYKISPERFGDWMQILRRVPDASLWLLDVNPDSSFRENLSHQADASGVGRERLVFMPKLAHSDYLARYQHVDLFLDTAPYTAHTTAGDAIFSGCPILTTRGESFASRVAASVCTRAELPDFVVDDRDYVDAAVATAGDPEALADARCRVAAARDSAYFDMARFAEDLAGLLTRTAER